MVNSHSALNAGWRLQRLLSIIHLGGCHLNSHTVCGSTQDLYSSIKLLKSTSWDWWGHWSITNYSHNYSAICQDFWLSKTRWRFAINFLRWRQAPLILLKFLQFTNTKPSITFDFYSKMAPVQLHFFSSSWMLDSLWELLERLKTWKQEREKQQIKDTSTKPKEMKKKQQTLSEATVFHNGGQLILWQTPSVFTAAFSALDVQTCPRDKSWVLCKVAPSLKVTLKSGFSQHCCVHRI